MLEAASALPNCKIDIILHEKNKHPITLSGIQTQNTLVALQAAAPSLNRLEVILDAEDELTINELGHVLASARGMTELSIRAYSQYDPDANVAHLTNGRWLRSSLDTFPRLTKLDLSNVCACAKKDWQHWFSLIQWPYLRKVHFTCATFVINGSAAMSQVTSLSLLLDDQSQTWGTYCPIEHGINAVRDSMYRFDWLRDLELRNATSIIDADLLVHLGKTLERLHVRENQKRDDVRKSAYTIHLSADLLGLMGSVCPLLGELAMDVPSISEGDMASEYASRRIEKI